jgi:hypothetical protein
MHAQQFPLPGGVRQTVLVLALLLSLAGLARGQSIETEGERGAQPLLLYPAHPPQGTFWTSMGFTAVAPPVEITEALQVRWPAFDYHTLYGLPNNFSIDGRAAVQVLQNRVAVGPRWVSHVGPVSLSLGYDLAFWFAFLKVEGFDSKGHGWQGSPSLSLGYQLGRNVAASVKGELMMDYSLKTSQGDLDVTSISSKTFTGYALTMSLEQPVYHEHYMTLSFRAMYTKFYWQTWSLYSTFDRFLFFPEIAVGFIL